MNSLPTLQIDKIQNKGSFDHQTIISALDTTIGETTKGPTNKM